MLVKILFSFTVSKLLWPSCWFLQVGCCILSLLGAMLSSNWCLEVGGVGGVLEGGGVVGLDETHY